MNANVERRKRHRERQPAQTMRPSKRNRNAVPDHDHEIRLGDDVWHACVVCDSELRPPAQLTLQQRTLHAVMPGERGCDNDMVLGLERALRQPALRLTMLVSAARPMNPARSR